MKSASVHLLCVFAAKLEEIYNNLFEHMVKLEEEKYDINQLVMAKDAEVTFCILLREVREEQFSRDLLKSVLCYLIVDSAN